MLDTPIRESLSTTYKTFQSGSSFKAWQPLHRPVQEHILLLSLTILLFLCSLVVDHYQPDAHAASPGPGYACSWYHVHAGDTLTRIAVRTHSSVSTLVRVNYIRNQHLIFVGQRLCIPYSVNQGLPSGVHPNGQIRWYAYDALEHSTPDQVISLIRQAAAYYGLPANLLLAIAWQESGWRHHVISRDGGIGVMQIMPYTARSLNIAAGIRRDPYKLRDNIYLGAQFLRSLWIYFGGNLTKIISAYNQGAWGVTHRGIRNWQYVNNVSYLMRVYR